MLDLKWIRRHPDILDSCLEKRGLPPRAHHILDLDTQHRSHLSRLQDIQTQRNQLDQLIAQRRAQSATWEDLQDTAQRLKSEAESNEYAEKHHHSVLLKALEELPNILDESVPFGVSEEDNKEITTWGHIPSMPWAKDHIALGHSLEGMNFQQAAIVAGSRFVYLKGVLARLERALAHWMLDMNTQEGFTEMYVPYLVSESAVFGAGLLPKLEQDMFRTTDGRFLIPTGEVSLVAWAQEKVFSEDELPVSLTAYTPCFRSEAGSAGKDTTGMIRQHQFHKVEMVVICTPEQAEAQHTRIVGQAEKLLQLLGLPYRKVLLCSHDTGATSCKTYDLEVWLPGQQKYREIASCSHCGDYQARRLNAKYRKTSDGRLAFTHTLNGSGLPTGRTLIALLENYQQPDGSIRIPDILVPYFGKETITNRVTS